MLSHKYCVSHLKVNSAVILEWEGTLVGVSLGVLQGPYISMWTTLSSTVSNSTCPLLDVLSGHLPFFARNKQRLLSWTRKKQTFLLAKLQNCWKVIGNILSVSFLVSCQAGDKYEIFPYFSPVRNTDLFLPNAHWFDAINCLTNGATEVKVWKHVCAA